LAFIVGELESIEGSTSKTASPVTVRVFAPPGQASEGRFGLDCAIQILEYFESIFGIPYPLPKMDLVAVPDFDAGAMENWGLVTYRLIYLLFDEKKSSSKAKQQVAYVVAHELAHQVHFALYNQYILSNSQ
jgi:aminopeptidase 2